MIYEWYVWLVLLTAEYCSIIRPYRVVDSTEWSSFTLVSNSDCTIASYFIYTVKEMMIFHAKIVPFGLATPVAALDSIFDIIQDNGLDTDESFLEIANLDTFLDCYDSSYQLYTAFAPTNKAFAALNKTFVTRITTNKEYFEHLRQLMHYHLIYRRLYSNTIKNGNCFGTRQGEKINITKSGNTITINSRAHVVLADMKASNGLVYTIDNVLIPNFLTQNLVQLIVTNLRYKTIASLGRVVNGLVVYLQGGSFTIFAPTNAAFAMLGNATMHTLLADPNGNLDSILKYHIVPGIITEKKLNDENLGTIQRATINVHVGTHSTKINGGACVTETNIWLPME